MKRRLKDARHHIIVLPVLSFVLSPPLSLATMADTVADSNSSSAAFFAKKKKKKKAFKGFNANKIDVESVVQTVHV